MDAALLTDCPGERGEGERRLATVAATPEAPFAGIIRSRFNGSAARRRDTLSLRDSAIGTAGWLPATSTFVH
jgi:hypothetical protein